LGFLLVVLLVLTLWLFQALTSPEIQEAVARRQSRPAAEAPSQKPRSEASEALLPTPESPGAKPKLVAAPEIVAMTAGLNAEAGSIEQDLEILGDVLRLYARVSGGPPAGLNEDITAALTGQNDKEAIVLPADHPALREGALLDRWGTPFWFHPVSASLMEIRSAGPDRELFTADDVVANDSGIMPKGTAEAVLPP
jgi:hypothetical protein